MTRALLIFLLAVRCVFAANTEFYMQPSGNDLSPGSTNSDTPNVTYTGGDWDAATDVYTAPSGADMTEAQAGRFASLYHDGDSVPVVHQYLIARITAVNAGTRQITLSTTARALLGTEVATGSANRSLRIGGKKKGPNGQSWHPLEMLSGALTNSSADIPRLSVLPGTYSLSDGTPLTSVTGTASTDLLTTSGTAPATGTGFRITFASGFSGLVSYVSNETNGSNPQQYYAVRISSTTFKAATTYANAVAASPTVVDIQTDGTGATVTPCPYGPTNSNAGPFVIEGCTTSAGDGTLGMTLPVIGGSGASLPFVGPTFAGARPELRYLQFTQNGADSPGPNSHGDWMIRTTSGGTSLMTYRCKGLNTWRNFMQLGGSGFTITESEAAACNVDAANTYGGFNASASGLFIRDTAHHSYKVGDAGSPGFVFQAGTGARITYIGCIAAANGGQGFWNASGGAVVTMIGCVADRNGRQGAELGNNANNAIYMENCLFTNNGTYGVTYPSSAVFTGRMLNCAFWGNTSGQVQNEVAAMSTGTVTLSSDPYVDGAHGNFALNTTSGAGAACRGAGLSAYLWDTSVSTAVSEAFSSATTAAGESIGAIIPAGSSGQTVFGTPP